MERTKTVKFNTEIEKEDMLFKWLQSLPHGEFTRLTKQFWYKEMERQKGEESHG